MKQFETSNRPRQNTKTRARVQCKCITCPSAIREEFEGRMMLICEDEACFLKCDSCTDRPQQRCSGNARKLEGMVVKAG